MKLNEKTPRVQRICCCISIFMLLLLAACGGSGDGDDSGSAGRTGEIGVDVHSSHSISQFGITWYFDRDYDSGQFANGDYWVVGPVTIVGIDPPSTQRGGRTMNGAMVNPSPTLGSTQGYDSAMYAGSGPTYDADLNVALDISSDHPLVLDPGVSLVSTISEAEAGARPQLLSAAVLTVLASAPPAGSFRPPYSGEDKTIRFDVTDLNYTSLASLPPLGSTPELADVARYFERPWIDHVPDWMADYLHPGENMPNYGREIANEVGIGALMLHLDFGDEEKEKLLIRYVQLGIDLFGIAQNGGASNWVPNGGHTSGRKWPILFAGMVLDDAQMLSVGTMNIYFGEDAQTFYVSQTDIDMTHSPDPRAAAVEYEQSDLGLPEWGIRHATMPAADNKNWSATYRRCCTTVAWNGFVLAAHIMGAKTLWNHDALFDYQDRYMQVTAEDGDFPGWRSWSDFTEEMWDTYRGSYGDLWVE